MHIKRIVYINNYIELIHPSYIMKVIYECGKLFQTVPNVQRIACEENKKITVIGDLHGQLRDLYCIFSLNGIPSPNNVYLFNGDLVDRGNYGLEIFFIVCCFKLLYPKCVFVNRGNHESESMNREYGFADEIYLKYQKNGKEIYRLFTDLFNTLPLGTVIDNKVL